MKILIGLECLSHTGLPLSLVTAVEGEREGELVAMSVCDT